MTYQTNSTSSEATEELAAQIGARLRGGEVIALSSDLGGGKTAFVRGLARGMGSVDHVSSPTFTLSRVYQAAEKNLMLYHFDFYRLQEPGIMALELAEVRDDPLAVVAVEWSDIVDDVLPDARLAIAITRTGDTTRDITYHYPEALSYLIPAQNFLVKEKT